jgi:hypothetical protein
MYYKEVFIGSVSLYHHTVMIRHTQHMTLLLQQFNSLLVYIIVMRRITTFRSTTDRIYDGCPIRL